jgi:hypothetical protein
MLKYIGVGVPTTLTGTADPERPLPHKLWVYMGPDLNHLTPKASI